MTNASSPPHVLRAQARKIAVTLKGAQDGSPDSTIKLADTVKFGVVMDDKVITIEMAWTSIRDFTIEGLTEYVLKQMQGEAT